MHVREAQRTLGSEIPWLCDTMENDLKHALGDAPNSEFVIDPEGKVVRKRSWSEPERLRKDLEELVGPVEKRTMIADLNRKTLPPPKPAASGIVPSLPRPREMRAVKIEPEIKEEGQPFYAKLRAEASPELLRDGKGKLYIGFHLDPLYHVHWNNLVAPVRVEIETGPAAKATPAEWEGPEVKEPADVDPREFLAEIECTPDQPRAPLKLTVRYFACNDEQGWCKSIRQQYLVHLEEDRDGGWVQQRNRRNGRPDQLAGARGPARPDDAGEFATGQIGSVNPEGRSLSVWNSDGRELTFQVAPDARIMRNGAPAAFEDLREGDRCRMLVEQPAEKLPLVVRMNVRGGGS
jgi:hypothetical protein